MEEGIAYPDDLPERDPDGYATLIEHAPTIEAEVAEGYGGVNNNGPLVKPVSWWLDKRLLRYGYHHRKQCPVVGFNLPFDLGRLAEYWPPRTRLLQGRVFARHMGRI